MIEGKKPVSHFFLFFFFLLSPAFMTTYLPCVHDHKIAGMSSVDVRAISFVLLSAAMKMNP